MRASLFVLLLVSSGAHAQVGFSAEDCNPDTVYARGPSAYGAEWASLHPARVVGSLQDDIEAGRWGPVGAALADNFRRSARVRGPARRSLQSHLDTLATELAEVGLEAMMDGRGVMRDRFAYDARDPVLFEFTPSEIQTSGLDPAVRREVCWRALVADNVLIQFFGPARNNAASALRDAIALWDEFNETNYSLYPWEVAVNQFLAGSQKIRSLDDLTPPATQLVFLHPGVALEAGGFGAGLDSLRRFDVLTLEPIGILWYNDERSSYMGVSAVVTIPTSGGPGIGGMVHFGRAVQVGAVVRGGSGPERGASIVLSTDVFKLIQRTPSAFRERIADLRDALPD
ncbi:MAG: hypothetical protein AAGI52_08360 [Bacteroidota bacterium]